MQRLTPGALRELAAHHDAIDGCRCRPLQTAGWRSLPAEWDETCLRQVGRVGDPDPYAEPTFAEYHPDGTRYESPLAPIAFDYFPTNRCDAWACVDCARIFLRYTEFGGYYLEHRIRMVDPARVIDDAPPPT